MSTFTTLFLIAFGISLDPNTGSELMVTTKTCLVRSGADLSYYEIAVLPEGAVVRSFPEENYGQFVAVKLGGGELGTFENITCDIELINTTSEAFDEEAMTYTARKGDRAALREIGVEDGKSTSRYKGASLTAGQVYKVLGVSVENERAIQRTVLEIAMPESSYAFVLRSNLDDALTDEASWIQKSKNPLFQAQTSEDTILKFRQQAEEQRRAEEEQKEKKKKAEEERIKQQQKEAEERRLAQEEEIRRKEEEAQRLAEEKRIKEEEELKRQQEVLKLEKGRLQQEEESNKQGEVQVDPIETTSPEQTEPEIPEEPVDPSTNNTVWDGTPVSIPEAWSSLESAWKAMVGGPILEAEPNPLRREFESLANQTVNEIVSGQAKRLLEAIDLFVLLQGEEQKFIELQARLGQLENDVAARQKLALSRTDLDFVGILSASKAYDGKPGANGRPRPLLLRLRDPVSQRTIVYLNPKGPLSEQLWQLSRNQAMIGISGNRGPSLLGVPQLQTVGTLEVLGGE